MIYFIRGLLAIGRHVLLRGLVKVIDDKHITVQFEDFPLVQSEDFPLKNNYNIVVFTTTSLLAIEVRNGCYVNDQVLVRNIEKKLNIIISLNKQHFSITDIRDYKNINMLWNNPISCGNETNLQWLCNEAIEIKKILKFGIYDLSFYGSWQHCLSNTLPGYISELSEPQSYTMRLIKLPSIHVSAETRILSPCFLVPV